MDMAMWNVVAMILDEIQVQQITIISTAWNGGVRQQSLDGRNIEIQMVRPVCLRLPGMSSAIFRQGQWLAAACLHACCAYNGN